MTTFGSREKAFEDKFAHDAEMQFKANARRDKLFGLWVAEMLGLTGEDAESYAKDMVKADLEEPGYQDVLRKAQADLTAAGKTISDHGLERQLVAFGAEAKAQIMSEI